MLEWLKKNSTILITVLVIVGFAVYLYGCEPKVPSLLSNGSKVNRQELQWELNQLVGLAQIRMIDLDKQDQLRALILQNAFVLVQGHPLDPIGILTGIAAIYGVVTGATGITKTVKAKVTKMKVNNG